MSAAAKGLHIALPAALSERLRALAGPRGAAPQHLAAAILHQAIAQEMVDEMIAPLRTELGVHGGGRRLDGLTELQAGVLYLVGLHAGADGFCRLSADSLALLLGRDNASTAATILNVLEAKKLIARGERKSLREALPYRLTGDGKAIFQGLAGAGDEGGKA